MKNILVCVLWMMAGFAAFPLMALTPLLPEGKKVKEPAKKWPKIECISNWGTITQHGDEVFFAGHPEWTAVGHFRNDGKLFLMWTFNEDGRKAPGLYVVPELRVKFPQLQTTTVADGQWGYADETAYDEKGELTGRVQDDHIYKEAVP